MPKANEPILAEGTTTPPLPICRVCGYAAALVDGPDAQALRHHAHQVPGRSNRLPVAEEERSPPFRY